MDDARRQLEVRYTTGVADDVFSGEYNAYLGISFSKTRYFSVSTIALYADWALRRFGHLVVILADHLEIYNQMVFKGRSYGEAVAATRTAAQQYRRAYLKGLHGCCGERLEVVLASELLEAADCATRVVEVQGMYRANPDFREAVRDTVFYALEGKLEERYGEETPGEVLDTLAQYFIEELGIILYLTLCAQPRYQVSIFPYPPPELLVDFYSGRYSLAGIGPPGQLPRDYPALQVSLAAEE